MKSKYQHDDLMYGVLLAAVFSFAVATVLDEVPVERFAAQAKATQVATAQAATPALVAKQASTVAH